MTLWYWIYGSEGRLRGVARIANTKALTDRGFRIVLVSGTGRLS